ncbi:MAG: efflux RND transporter periplasmic adaptor subunit [Nevskiaceae bacterium]|jgi:RND family efflux transporter MFP subunit|nr:efflux RND transporter periplasmic adaptor subunit [Nevskiaceae bacterium]
MRFEVANARGFAPLVLLIAALAACSQSQGPRPVADVPAVQTLTVGAADVANGRAWEGVVEAVRQATLSAQTGGRVTEVRRDVNDQVSAGEVLVRLTAVEQQASADAARAQLQAADASVVEAEATYRRFVELSESQFVSKMQLDQVRAARDAAVAARNAAQAQLAQAGQQADYTTIRSPYAGIVAARDVEPGETVAPGRVLMSVFSPDQLRIEVSIPQADAAAIRAMPEARIMLGDARVVDAAQVIVFPSADPVTHSVNVRVQLPALEPAPLPGSTAKVAFPAITGAAFSRVPAASVMHRGEVNAVYVMADGRLSMRQLRLGERFGDEVEVISGLKSGEIIAADPVAAAQALADARKGGN